LTDRNVDVAVVGAGLAGVTAARTLAASGRSVAVLEARDRVGGRTLNVGLSDGYAAEIGGQFVGPRHTALLGLAGEVGVGTYRGFAEGESLYERDGLIERHCTDEPAIASDPNSEIAVACRKLDELALGVPVEVPWEAYEADRLDGTTMRSWLEAEIRSEESRRYLEVMIEGFWAADASELSVLHILFYIHAVEGLRQLTGIDGAALERRFAGGSQLVSIRVAEELGDSVMLGTPVLRILTDNGGVQVETASGRIGCEQVVVALPPPLAGRLTYEPQMTGFRDQLTQRMPLGATIKAVIEYERHFWRDEGLTGRVLSLNGPVTYVYDSTPPGADFGVLACFVCGNRAQRLGRENLPVRKAAILGCIDRILGPAASQARRYFECSWAEERWTRGAYFANFQTGGWTAVGPALRAPVGPIHWAGTELATGWPGHMEGAVRSGLAAAAEVLS
jgi:monoamine oxidase